MDRGYPAHNVTPELATVEDAARRRAPKPAFKRFDVLFIGGAALAWAAYLAWSWSL